MALELALVAPGILLIFGLIIAYGRAGQVNGVLESGTRDAVRSATLARSTGAARDRVETVLRSALTDAPPGCRETLSFDIVGDFLPDHTIRVEATCRYPISDLGLPGAPGHLTARSSFTSMLDQYRRVQ